MFKIEKGFGASLVRWVVAGRHTLLSPTVRTGWEGRSQMLKWRWAEITHQRRPVVQSQRSGTKGSWGNQATEGQDTTFNPLRLAGWEQELWLGLQEAGARDEETWGWQQNQSEKRMAGAEQGGGRIRIKAGDWRLATEKHKSVRWERPPWAGLSSSLGCFSQLRSRSKAQKHTFAGCSFQVLMLINWPVANFGYCRVRMLQKWNFYFLWKVKEKWSSLICQGEVEIGIPKGAASRGLENWDILNS